MLDDQTRGEVDSFLREWDLGSRRAQARLRSRMPIASMQRSAVGHEDPWARRRCLDFLDHYAADESVAVFLDALNDPVAPVRGSALHGLACERCRTEALCVPDVLAGVNAVLESDPDPEVRSKSIAILLRLASRDRAALLAIERAAETDGDERVRAVASAALRGEHPPRWNHARRAVGSRRSKASNR